jgi:UDP-glucose 4-epimerase
MTLYNAGMSKHILVTGGAGFIASHIVDAYLQRGHRVTVLDDLSTGQRENVNPAAEFVEGSITDAAVIERVVTNDVDVINHHAAQIDVRKSVADPPFDAELNIIASLRLFERARAAGVKKLIFASSGGAAYGEPQFTPQNEEHPFAPMSPYGCAKLSVEHYLGFYRSAYGLSTTSLRYGNVYGPRQRKDGEAGVVAIFAGKILDGDAVTINGDGEQTRDYVFIDDVVRANVAVTEHALDGAWNVGTGIETSVNALYATLCRILEVEPNAEHAPAKRGEQKRSVLDATRLRTRAALPEPIGLEDGMRRTVEWLKAMRNA